MFSIKQLRYLLLIPLAAVIIGTVGFMLLEKLSLFNAFYFTITTIATVGYGDITPTTIGGKVLAIIIIIIGISTFLTLLTGVTQRLVQRRQLIMQQHRLNMLIGVFFTEVGNELLRILTGIDSGIAGIRRDFLVTVDWNTDKFQQLKSSLNSYEYKINPAILDLEKLHHFLQEKGDVLVRQLESADLVENESFAELLWAAVHLRDELAARPSLKGLPGPDIAHLANDTKRVYSLLAMQWIEYMQYLKNRYPFLFSFALRTNPFVENPSAVISK